MSGKLTPAAAAVGREDQELARLIAEQEVDARWGHRVNTRALSLDYSFADGSSVAEIVGSRDTRLAALTEDPTISVRRIARPQKWTKRTIVRVIRQWVREHGDLPFYVDWNRPNGRGVPSAASVARAFGSWNAGMVAAGFEPRSSCRRNPIREGTKRPRIRQQKRTARLTSDDLAAAYVLYDRQRLSLPEIADLIWERFGYPSSKACRDQLWKGFHAEGFRLRTKSEARICLPAEKRWEIARAMARGRYEKATA